MKKNIWRGPDGKDHKVTLEIREPRDGGVGGKILLLIDGWYIVGITPSGRLERYGSVHSETGLALKKDAGRIKRVSAGEYGR